MLYRSIQPRLRTYAARRVGTANADDVVGEALLRAFVSIGSFVWGPAGFDGWVFGIARRCIGEHHRRDGQRSRLAHAPRPEASNEPEPGDGLILEDERAEIRRAFARLGARDQDLLELRFIAGLNCGEVATVLGKTPGAVRTAQSRAVQELRRLMCHFS
jgi:RNA polymerase sigma-70 factor (ECF subfamily)